MLFLLLHDALSVFIDNRAIHGDIKATWKETPLLGEALCFMQDVDHAAYWDAIETLSTSKVIPETLSDVISFSKNYIDEELTNLLNISLLIRYYSPRIDYFRSQNKASGEIVENGNILEYEPILGSGNSTKILYADIRSKDWVANYKQLQSGDASFAIRVVGYSDQIHKLSGYGMQLKPFKYSMEFSVKNNAKASPADAKIKAKPTYDNLDIDLKVFDKKVNSTKKIAKKRIAMQVLQFIQNSTDPIKTFTELTRNYPLFQSHISSTKVNEQFEARIQRLAHHTTAGNTVLFVNGRKLEGADLSAASVFKTLLEEYRVKETLSRSFDLSKEMIGHFLKAGSSLKTQQFPKVDARHPLYINWLNDLEKDEKYQKYTKSLTVFIGDTDNFPNIARNLANAIFFVDPSDANDLQTIGAIDELVENQFPVHIGYVVVPKKRTALSRKIHYAFAHLSQKYGPKTAHKFLVRVNDMRSEDEKTHEKGPVRQKFWEESFGSLATDRHSPSFNKVTSLMGPNTVESRFLTKIQQYVDSVGVGVPCVIMNGNFVEETSPEKYIRSLLSEQMNVIRDLMGKRQLSDSTTDMHDLILRKSGALKRYNPLVQRASKDFSETLDIQEQCAQNQRHFVKWIPTIDYQHGSTISVKNQTHWIFINTNSNKPLKEVDAFANDIANRDHSRIAIYKKGELPPQIIVDMIGVPEEKVTVVFNGRIVRFDPDKFSRYDLQLLEMWEEPFSTSFAESYLKNVASSRSLGQAQSHREISDTLLYMEIVAGSLSHKGTPRTGTAYNTFGLTGNNIFQDQRESNLLIELIADPLSEAGQKMAALVPMFRKFSFGLMLNPPYRYGKHDEVEAIGSFYRTAFDAAHPGQFEFEFMNESTTYSLIEDLPHTWQVRRSVAGFDMDNIDVAQLQPGIHNVEYELKSILVEGCSYDADGRVVNGLELTAANMSGIITDETRVISRNGYWQLNGVPGNIVVRTNADYMKSIPLDSHFPVFTHIESLTNLKFNVNLSIVDDRIHVFIVASGHLYERLMKITMLSIMKNTKSPVTFWLLENFVSPQHRASLPEFAKKYGFEIQFCSYKWPRWMPHETARQRLFWGYKILFLDVMFPNSLKRVIYVDSDQIIRADLKELMTMKFDGAPYAFTPFCDTRPEMAEYRFWQKGYWKNLLNGKPYHISALFAVDLDKFRQMEVGDMLRKAYMDLANDKKSLANLDQDLPNMLQDRAPIFSLPQEWLWCGSWCADEELAKAKTIDLCNNPRTKVGKLEYAKATIPEWIPYDEEANGKISDEL